MAILVPNLTLRALSICTLAGPSAPTNLNGITLNETTIQLDWSRPVNPNGIILGYQVFYYGYMGDPTEVNTVTFAWCLLKYIVLAMGLFPCYLYACIHPSNHRRVSRLSSTDGHNITLLVGEKLCRVM